MSKIKEENLHIECPYCNKGFVYRHRYGSKPWDEPEEEEELEENEEDSEGE